MLSQHLCVELDAHFPITDLNYTVESRQYKIWNVMYGPHLSLNDDGSVGQFVGIMRIGRKMAGQQGRDAFNAFN